MSKINDMKIEVNQKPKTTDRPNYPYLALSPSGYAVLLTTKGIIYLLDAAMSSWESVAFTEFDFTPLERGESITLTQD